MARTILSIFFPILSQTVPPTERTAALKQLASWAYQFSPIVAVDNLHHDENRNAHDKRSYGLNIDISGTERLFDGTRLIEAKLREAADKRPLRFAIAPTLGSAWALSRYNLESEVVIKREHLKAALSPLPIAALRIGKKTAQSLQELHIRMLGQLFVIPQVELRKRFALELVVRLNQLFDEAAEPLAPHNIKKPPQLSHLFPEPVLEKSVIEHVVLLLFKKLFSGLVEQHLSISRIELRYELEGGTVMTQTISLTSPSQQYSHLERLIKHKLELLTVTRGVERIAVAAPSPAAIRAVQTSEGSANEHSSLGELLDAVKDRIGADRVCRCVRQARHLPEESFSYQPLQTLGTHLSQSPLVLHQRPSLLFSSPQPITALASLPDGPPHRITWKEQSFLISGAIGPERIAPPWWGENRLTATRDYFRAKLPSGMWLWIFREKDSNRWFLHGIWA